MSDVKPATDEELGRAERLVYLLDLHSKDTSMLLGVMERLERAEKERDMLAACLRRTADTLRERSRTGLPRIDAWMDGFATSLSALPLAVHRDVHGCVGCEACRE